MSSEHFPTKPPLQQILEDLSPEVKAAFVTIVVALVGEDEVRRQVTPKEEVWKKAVKKAKRSKPQCTAHHPTLGRGPGVPCIRDRGHGGKHRTANNITWTRRGQ